MKKKKIANLIMVLIILVIVATGILTAMHFMPQKDENALGGKFETTAIPNGQLFLSDNPENICTISIRCDTILDNLDNLTEEKVPYVPVDGIILPETQVEFIEGETVFEVLQRVCEAADIQLEYSWTPLYDSYYIEGINHLYEFDCGHESGWMYKVNEWFPNYGCSAYKLTGGETIVWCYTCNGLGADVGETRVEDA